MDGNFCCEAFSGVAVLLEVVVLVVPSTALLLLLLLPLPPPLLLLLLLLLLPLLLPFPFAPLACSLLRLSCEPLMPSLCGS